MLKEFPALYDRELAGIPVCHSLVVASSGVGTDGDMKVSVKEKLEEHQGRDAVSRALVELVHAQQV